MRPRGLPTGKCYAILSERVVVKGLRPEHFGSIAGMADAADSKW